MKKAFLLIAGMLLGPAVGQADEKGVERIEVHHYYHLVPEGASGTEQVGVEEETPPSQAKSGVPSVPRVRPVPVAAPVGRGGSAYKRSSLDVLGIPIIGFSKRVEECSDYPCPDCGVTIAGGARHCGRCGYGRRSFPSRPLSLHRSPYGYRHGYGHGHLHDGFGFGGGIGPIGVGVHVGLGYEDRRLRSLRHGW